MLQKDQVDSYIKRAQETIDHAIKELTDVKLIQQNDPTEFPYLMNQINELDTEINDLLTAASSDQRQQLEQVQHHLRETKTFMIRGI